MVEGSNLVSYIQAVVDATLGAGIEAQLQAFRVGFNEVSRAQTAAACGCNNCLSLVSLPAAAMLAWQSLTCSSSSMLPAGWCCADCHTLLACCCWCVAAGVLLLLLQVFSLDTLAVFREDEMEALLCGAGEHWSPQQLADSMKFDHGYTSQSVPVRWARGGWGHAPAWVCNVCACAGGGDCVAGPCLQLPAPEVFRSLWV